MAWKLPFISRLARFPRPYGRPRPLPKSAAFTHSLMRVTLDRVRETREAWVTIQLILTGFLPHLLRPPGPPLSRRFFLALALFSRELLLLETINRFLFFNLAVFRFLAGATGPTEVAVTSALNGRGLTTCRAVFFWDFIVFEWMNRNFSLSGVLSMERRQGCTRRCFL